jgi:uncharacterized membrane protein YgaE (UPF0421/DUF939 family)
MRTTVAAAVSFMVARSCGLPEAYWAVVTTVIVMQSTLGAAWNISAQRLAGTILGGITAVGLTTILEPGILPYVIGMVLMGLVCAVLALETSAYRFAGITLAVILLAAHISPIWIVSLHRFFEVTVGIFVGMFMVAIWPEQATPKVTSAPK